MIVQTMLHVTSDGIPEQPPDVVPTRSYHAELSAELLDPRGELLDYLIGYAFDTLGALQLTIRVTPGALPTQLPPTVL